MAFVPEAALIALREGLEAFLVVGLLLGLVTRLGRPDARRHVWLGFGAAVAASLVLGLLIQAFLLERFESAGGGEAFELVAALAAVVLLTYMIVWMWRHTREHMAASRAKVAAALGAGSLATIVAIAFASVLREGLEVVLFYAALGSRASALDLAWSAAVGFAASALLVAAILRGAARVDLARFFGLSGVLLVFMAAGLLVHSVLAATTLGLLAPAPALWDSSGLLPDDSAAGRVAHAVLGYASTPTLLQATLYFGYLAAVGGGYLASLGAFHRRAAGGRRIAGARVAVAAVALLLVAAAVGMGAVAPRGPLVAGHGHGAAEDAHDHEDEVGTAALHDAARDPLGRKVGVLLRSHGEPIHYNATTYRSFADFVRSLLVLFGEEELLLVDQGTAYLDSAHPFEKGPRADAQLIDAWLGAGTAAVYAGLPQPLPVLGDPLGAGYYLAPGGPGLGEPDILEMAGLSAWRDWQQMENESPMHEGKLATLDAAARTLEHLFGDEVVVLTSYHVLPHVGGPESDAEAAEAFVAAGVGLVVDAYTSAVFSDVMNTCMMRPHLLHALEAAGYTGPVVHARPAGLFPSYARAVAAKVASEVAREPADAKVAVFLTHHGAKPSSTNPCGGGPDQYHENARDLFAASARAVEALALGPRVAVFQVYGQGADAADDGVLSPLEAAQAAAEWGADRVVDIPYELSANGYDNLVAHRASYGLDPREAPHYDEAHETTLEVDGLPVRIASSLFGTEDRAAALVEAILEALGREPPQPHVPPSSPQAFSTPSPPGGLVR